MIQMVACDVAGTTVNDDGVVLRAFTKAFSSIAPDQWAEKKVEWTQYAIDTMGQSKIKVFTEILQDAELAQSANLAFEAAYLELIETEGAAPIAGAEEFFEMLREMGIPVVLTTGFSRPTLDTLLEKLGWNRLINLSVVPAEAGEGRPSPAMLEFAARALGVTDPATCVVVGDTDNDMLSGVAFGAGHRIGVLSGAHAAPALAQAGATEIVNSVADIGHLLFA
ncbi:MAG: hypothetical protein RL670_414 [Actinomycetota bacterium]|jgi:phosphonatase-like hydrolase